MKDEVLAYQKETNKYAVWRGVVTEGIKKFLKGEKIYDRDKERISLYVSEETKTRWQEFIKRNKYSTISKLIRMSVDDFINRNSLFSSKGLSNMDDKSMTAISHSLKEPLTSIKGFSQLIIENYRDKLDPDIFSTIKNIFDKSVELESKIRSLVDRTQVETKQFDILLIEDDLATIRLITTFFKSKGFSCYGSISGIKAIESLNSFIPKLILLDVILPDMSGYELSRKIKTNKQFKDIPVYFLTAIPASEVKKRIGETGADGFILKPFDFKDFDILFKYLK